MARRSPFPPAHFLAGGTLFLIAGISDDESHRFLCWAIGSAVLISLLLYALRRGLARSTR